MKAQRAAALVGLALATALAAGACGSQLDVQSQDRQQERDVQRIGLGDFFETPQEQARHSHFLGP